MFSSNCLEPWFQVLCAWLWILPWSGDFWCSAPFCRLHLPFFTRWQLQSKLNLTVKIIGLMSNLLLHNHHLWANPHSHIIYFDPKHTLFQTSLLFNWDPGMPSWNGHYWLNSNTCFFSTMLSTTYLMEAPLHQQKCKAVKQTKKSSSPKAQLPSTCSKWRKG